MTAYTNVAKIFRSPLTAPKPWTVQYRSRFSYFATYADAFAFARTLNA